MTPMEHPQDTPAGVRELPPLPRPHGYVGAALQYCRQQDTDPIPSASIARYTAEQMQAYARAAIDSAAQQSAERLAALSGADLHQRIMNLPCRLPCRLPAGWIASRGYTEGHRDARHAAAELVAQASVAMPLQPAEIDRAHALYDQYIKDAIDRAPEPLRRLGEWLAKKLDEDDFKTAERYVLGAMESVSASPSIPPQGVRMLTPQEFLQADREWDGVSPWAEALQRKFCEVNGLSLSHSTPQGNKEGER